MLPHVLEDAMPQALIDCLELTIRHLTTKSLWSGYGQLHNKALFEGIRLLDQITIRPEDRSDVADVEAYFALEVGLGC